VDAAQTYVERLPLPALAARVRTVWVQRIGPSPYLQRNLPTGGVELHCPIGGVPRLVGPLTGAAAEVLPPGAAIVGARFWPGAAAPLLGPPAVDLLDLTVPMDALWPSAAARLGELLAEVAGPDAARPDAALEVLQRYLVHRLRRSAVPDPLVAEAVRWLMPWQPVQIGPLTRHLAISASQLRRRFLRSVGVGPKSLQRTLRFQGYLALVQAGSTPGGRLADLAAEAGYADHAHLSRECVRLTGRTPRELLGDVPDRCGCEHDHSASYGPFLAGRTWGKRTG
jgi:AraC-like DNA-binding protein